MVTIAPVCTGIHFISNSMIKLSINSIKFLSLSNTKEIIAWICTICIAFCVCHFYEGCSKTFLVLMKRLVFSHLMKLSMNGATWRPRHEEGCAITIVPVYTWLSTDVKIFYNLHKWFVLLYVLSNLKKANSQGEVQLEIESATFLVLNTTKRPLGKTSLLCLSWERQQLAQILPAIRLSLFLKSPCAAEYVVHAWCFVSNASAQVPCIQ